MARRACDCGYRAERSGDRDSPKLAGKRHAWALSRATIGVYWTLVRAQREDTDHLQRDVDIEDLFPSFPHPFPLLPSPLSLSTLSWNTCSAAVSRDRRGWLPRRAAASHRWLLRSLCCPALWSSCRLVLEEGGPSRATNHAHAAVVEAGQRRGTVGRCQSAQHSSAQLSASRGGVVPHSLTHM